MSCTQEEFERDLLTSSLDEEDKQSILEIMQPLSEKVRAMILMRIGFYGKPRTIEEISIAFGISKERVRKIENKCLRVPHHIRRSDKVREFLNS